MLHPAGMTPVSFQTVYICCLVSNVLMPHHVQELKMTRWDEKKHDYMKCLFYSGEKPLDLELLSL